MPHINLLYEVIIIFKNIEERVYEEAKCLIKNYLTVREVAKKFKISKSTVHKDLAYRLKDIDNDLYLEVKKIFTYNTNVRHIRGGEATRKKFLKDEK